MMRISVINEIEKLYTKKKKKRKINTNVIFSTKNEIYLNFPAKKDT